MPDRRGRKANRFNGYKWPRNVDSLNKNGRDREMLNLVPGFSSLNVYDDAMSQDRGPPQEYKNMERGVQEFYFKLVSFKVNWDFKGRCLRRIEIHRYKAQMTEFARSMKVK